MIEFKKENNYLYNIYGAKVHIVSTANVTIGISGIIQVITPYSQNGKIVEVVDTSTMNSLNLYQTSRYLSLMVSDQAMSSMKVEEFIDDKCMNDFTYIVNKIEKELDETFFCNEKTVYFLTKPIISVSSNKDFYTNEYQAKYSFSFYKPLTYDSYKMEKEWLS